jgi:hypothetical protein
MISEADLIELERQMREALETIRREREQKAVLVKMLLEEKQKHEALRKVRGFQS